jgi:hypothetical protein
MFGVAAFFPPKIGRSLYVQSSAMITRMLGFVCIADSRAAKTPRPATADAAANPAYPKNSRLFNIFSP